MTELFWEEFYSNSDRVWSGNPNPILVREVAGLTPGTALDLGCGEGADAIWLARQGWRVTAVDVSAIALRRAAAHAVEAEVTDRIDWQQHDLASTFPVGTFDLVSAQFLHSPVHLPREAILQSAAMAVAPGGVLLVAGHANSPSTGHDHHPDMEFPTPTQVLDSLELVPEGWTVESTETVERTIVHNGHSVTRADNVLRVRRLR